MMIRDRREDINPIGDSRLSRSRQTVSNSNQSTAVVSPDRIVRTEVSSSGVGIEGIEGVGGVGGEVVLEREDDNMEIDSDNEEGAAPIRQQRIIRGRVG